MQADHFDAFHFMQAQRVIECCMSLDNVRALKTIFSEVGYVEKFAKILDGSLGKFANQPKISLGKFEKIYYKLKRLEATDAFANVEVCKWWELLANPYECNEANFADSVAKLVEKYVTRNQIKGSLSPLALELMHDARADFNAVTRQIGKKPTPEQMGAIVVALQALHRKHNRQMWYLRPGCGKSLMLQIIGWLYVTNNPLAKVTFVIPDQALLQRDYDEFAGFWGTLVR